ncbi:MAG: pantoate--beta-alanine ligase [Halieaceae bacterium]|nr:pantoate--beta-alanine ligase [Halieaceae bacterium]
MQTLTSIKALQEVVKQQRLAGRKIGFVPTMGNLHDGHLSLVRKAKQLSDFVVTSIFVNPLQFGAGEDLDNYPRTLETDSKQLELQGNDIVFVPSVAEMYPRGMSTQTQVSVPQLSETLCGASRPGHFDGVTTVVTKLFNMVQPDLAVFGEKDFQQLSIICKMVDDLCMPIEIVGVPTGRAADGLALSSRNGYLTADERLIAPELNKIIQSCKDAILSGSTDFSDLEASAKQGLQAAGFKPDYFAIRDSSTLTEVTKHTQEIAILAAARLGATRLIDNTRLAPPK